MPQKRHLFRAGSALFLSLLVTIPGVARAALPPVLEAKPLFGDTLVQGRWQPIVVIVTNQDGGDALTGEVKTSLGDSGTGEVFGSAITPVILPRGAGTARAITTVFVPESDPLDLFVSLRRGRDGKGEVVTRRTFTPQRLTVPSLTLLTVTTLPDVLSYLRGEKLGAENTSGVLRPFMDTAPAKQNNLSYGQRTAATATEIHIENLAEAGLLPGTAAGYDTIGIVYLGPDVGPAQFSDAQVSGLRGWVVGGGLLVVGSPVLRTDERFRTWVPVIGPAGTAGIRTNQMHVGRGLVASVVGDLAEAGFARSPAALTFWRGLVRDACSEPLAGTLIQNRGVRDYYPQRGFWASVIRAPGLKAPPAGAIALFLLAYMILLVPVNYFILKRLDRREWTWATVPILVTLFSVGAYVFGYAVKGTQMLQNTVTLCEMGANRGDVVVTASVGIFSPRQTSYDLSTILPDTTFWTPQTPGRYNRDPQEYGPLEVATPGETGGESAVHIRNADISMWAMRVFAARTYRVKLGNGVAANLVQSDGQLTGTVTNNTSRPLTQVSLLFNGGRTNLGLLEPGAQQKVFLKLPPDWKKKPLNSRRLLFGSPLPNSAFQEFQRPILESIDSTMQSFTDKEKAQGNTGDEQSAALLLAWNQGEIFPIKIDGQTIPTGTNLNLITVTIPVGKK